MNTPSLSCLLPPEGFTDSHGNHPALPHTLPEGPDLSRVAALTGSRQRLSIVLREESVSWSWMAPPASRKYSPLVA